MLQQDREGQGAGLEGCLPHKHPFLGLSLDAGLLPTQEGKNKWHRDQLTLPQEPLNFPN